MNQAIINFEKKELVSPINLVYGKDGKDYEFEVIPENTYGAHPEFTSQSELNEWVIQKINNVDVDAPIAPDLVSSNITDTSATITMMSTDNVGVSNYKLYDAAKIEIAQAEDGVFNLTDLTTETTYTYYGKAFDAAGNESGFSAVLSITTEATPVVVDTISKPSNIRATNITQDGISLAWVESTSEDEISHYRLYKDDELQEDDINGLETIVNELTLNTIYKFEVTAVDEFGNESEKSVSKNISTLNTGEIYPINPLYQGNILHDFNGQSNKWLTFVNKAVEEVSTVIDAVDQNRVYLPFNEFNRPIYSGGDVALNNKQLINSSIISGIGKNQNFAGFIVFKIDQIITTNNVFRYVIDSANRFGLGLRNGKIAVGYYNGTSFVSKGVDFSDTINFHVLSYRVDTGIVTAQLDGITMIDENVFTPSTTEVGSRYGDNTSANNRVKRNVIVSGDFTDKPGIIEYINNTYGFNINSLA